MRMFKLNCMVCGKPINGRRNGTFWYDETSDKWRLEHRECDTEAENLEDGTSYWFEWDRLTTPGDALDWYNHLKHRRNFSPTAWYELLNHLGL